MSKKYHVSDAKDVVTIEDGEITYFIKKEGWILDLLCIGIDKEQEGDCDINIPHLFPSGHRIDIISPDFFKSVARCITISDEIEVLPWAFRGTRCSEVVWPRSCKTIPKSCFFESSIKKISNIDNVETVEKNAFAMSSIKEFQWPKNCDSIPEVCFWHCRELTNIDMPNVKEVGKGAFSHTGLKDVVWPSSCKVIPCGCFDSAPLSKISNIEHVEQINAYAFNMTDVEFLDLSGVSYLEQGALLGLPDECEIIPPYYVSEVDYKKAFLEEEKE